MSDTLLGRSEGDPAVGTSPDRPWELPAPPPRRTRSGPRWSRGWAAVAAVVALLLAAAVARPPVVVAQAGPVSFDADATHLTLERFDERGVYSLRYVHGEYAEVWVPVRNDGWLTTTVTHIAFDGRPAPMIDPVGSLRTPLELAPGGEAVVAVQVRFDNCEYYTERAMDVYDAVTVTSRTAGLTSSSRVELDHALVVRSPMMTTCPDRVSDRGAFLRGG